MGIAPRCSRSSPLIKIERVARQYPCETICQRSPQANRDYLLSLVLGRVGYCSHRVPGIHQDVLVWGAFSPGVVRPGWGGHRFGAGVGDIFTHDQLNGGDGLN